MANAATRLAESYTTSATSCPGTKTVDEGFSYSARGELQDVWENTPHSGGWYHVNASYWANGNLNVLNGGASPLPGLPAITYGASDGSGIDGEGRITKVNAASGQNPVTSVGYNVSSQVTGVTLGSLDNDSYQYDTNTGRMTQYKFNMGTGPQSQTGQLNWNANGTLQQLQITDQINTANSQTCNFWYDDLGRLAGQDPVSHQTANCGTPWQQTFSLDPFGNLKQSGSANFPPTYTGESGTSTTPSNQYYQISGGNPGASNYYDLNGNLKNDVTHSYTWDADGNMLSVDGSTVTMIYDAQDRMIEQTRGSSHTEIAYGPYGLKLALMNGQTLVNAFVKLPGGARAVYNNSGLAYYRHADHLGSSRLATTPSRTKYYDVAYAPYGEEYDGSGTQDLAFTDQNQDTASGGWSGNLYDFMFREYRTAHGRWTSPDPAGLAAVDPNNPQSWNRYAYVNNNPLGLVDPVGLEWACVGHNGKPPRCVWHSDCVGFGASAAISPGYSPGNCWFPMPALPAFDGLGNGGGSIPSVGAAPPPAKRPWYKNSCITSALGDAALHVGIDAIGLIPEAGGLARVIGHQAGYVGVVADQLGTKVIQGVGGSAGAVQGLAGLGDTSPEGLVSTGLTVAGFIPGLGQAAAVGSIGVDVYKTVKAIGQCH
jgi:RHS repeat-associated protein